MDKLARQDRRIRYLNVERYRRLLKHAADEDRRRRLQELIDEELQKQKSASNRAFEVVRRSPAKCRAFYWLRQLEGSSKRHTRSTSLSASSPLIAANIATLYFAAPGSDVLVIFWAVSVAPRRGRSLSKLQVTNRPKSRLRSSPTFNPFFHRETAENRHLRHPSRGVGASRPCGRRPCGERAVAKRRSMRRRPSE